MSKRNYLLSELKTDEQFAAQYGELGPVYGHQWRNFEGVDQLAQIVEDIKTNPDSRRLIVSAWNPKDIPVMAKSGLPPCHTLFQFYVTEGRLSCQLYQRSADVLLGVPFNIASYALLTLMIAQVAGLQPGDFVHTFGDAHLYSNHMEQVEEQLSREPHSLPVMSINSSATDLFSFQYDDFELKGYEPYPPNICAGSSLMSADIKSTNRKDANITLSLIVAMADNRTIGRNNELPWHLPDDLKYFKSVTMGKPIVMGRKTFDSIGRPLPGRLNIVITRNAEWQHSGVKTAASLQQAVAIAAEANPQDQEALIQAALIQEVMVIGGEEIYRTAIELADRLYITRVQAEVEGDAFFPQYNESEWQEVSRQAA